MQHLFHSPGPGLSHVQEERASTVTYSVFKYHAVGLHYVPNSVTLNYLLIYTKASIIHKELAKRPVPA